MKKGKLVFTLFYTMLKIGLFTFGGGYGMIALLENEFVSKRKWMTKEEFLDMIAIAESSPGPIAINSATYIGYKMAKFWGSLAATVAVCIPSFVIIFLISLFLDAFLAFEYVGYAFKGIQVGVAFLIFNAGLKMLKDIKKKPLPIIIFSATTICMVCFSIFAIKFSSIFYIIIGGVLALLVYNIVDIYSKIKLKKLEKSLQTEGQCVDKPKTDVKKETLQEVEKEVKENNDAFEKAIDKIQGSKTNLADNAETKSKPSKTSTPEKPKKGGRK